MLLKHIKCTWLLYFTRNSNQNRSDMVNKTSIVHFFPNKYVVFLSRQNLYKYPTFIRNTLFVTELQE